MWQIAIPIPNWTGILMGFCPGVIVGIAIMILIAWWGNRQTKKKEELEKKTLFDLMGQQQGIHEQFLEQIEKDQID